MTAETESGRGLRARALAAVDRLHAAQVAALAAAMTGAAATGAAEECAVAACDAYGAERRLLERVGEMGSLLVRLGRLAPGDAEAAELRRRLVTLAVGCANTLAELVSLAFELDEVERGYEAAGAGDMALGVGASARGAAAVARPAAPAAGRAGGGRARGSNGASPPARATTSMRAVTDTNRLLIEQLRRLMQNAGRRESWRSAGPGELWRRLLVQAAGLLPLVVALEAGELSEQESRELRRTVADAANYLAFLWCYPRMPTA